MRSDLTQSLPWQLVPLARLNCLELNYASHGILIREGQILKSKQMKFGKIGQYDTSKGSFCAKFRKSSSKIVAAIQVPRQAL